MKFTKIVSLGAVATGSWASSIEPANFNITEALLNTGVNVSAIPELFGLVERSSMGACSIAVGYPHPSPRIFTHADD
jgi:hypothetical protein